VIIFTALLIFLLFSKLSYAQVKITSYSATSPEYIEISNTGSTEVDINNWRLRDYNAFTKDQTGFLLTGQIGISETKKYDSLNFNLNDDGDIIYLHDNSSNLIDQLNYGKYITPTPTPIPTETPIPSNTPIPDPTATPSPTGEPTATPTTYPKVENLYINEIMPNPDTGSEWLELFNNNDYDINLENYKIKDDTTHYRIIGANTISAHSYFIFMFNNYLNNDGDSLSLYDNLNRQIGKTVIFTNSTKGRSYSLQDDDSWCFALSTMNSDNNSCFVGPTDTPKPTSTPHPTSTPRPTSTPKPKKSPNQKITKTPTPAKTKNKLSSNSYPNITLYLTPKPTNIISDTSPPPIKETNSFSTFFISAGAFLLLAPIFLL